MVVPGGFRSQVSGGGYVRLIECLSFALRSLPIVAFVWFFGKAPRYAVTVADVEGNVKSPLRGGGREEDSRDLFIASMGSDDLEVSLMEEEYDQQLLRHSASAANKYSLSHRFSLLSEVDGDEQPTVHGQVLCSESDSLVTAPLAELHAQELAGRWVSGGEGVRSSLDIASSTGNDR